MFTELALMNYLGWGGAVGLGMFYWFFGSGRIMLAYAFSMIGASMWLSVGVLTYYGYATELPSLIGTELMVILLNVRGIHRWRTKGLI